MEKNIKNILIKKINHQFSLDLKKNLKIKRIDRGRNNILYTLKHKKLSLVIKYYSNKKKSTFQREKFFYQYLIKNSIQNVPKYFFSVQKQISVFEYLEGNPIKVIKNFHINDSIKFINDLNTNCSKKKFSVASDGCLSIADHIKIVSSRIKKFSNLIEKYYKNKKIYFFIKRKIIPRFNYEQKFLLQNYKKNFKSPFKSNELILSPSDYGFHNMLTYKKKTFFFDFEYAGIDDASKLICDFICQPDMALKNKHINLLLKNINFRFKNNKKIIERTKILLNIHRIKWCMVILNIFVTDVNGELKLNLKKLQNRQLEKSISYYNKYL